MDIEGYEAKALAGMKKTLGNGKELKMLIEFFPLSLTLSGSSPRNLLEQLSEMGFTIYDVKDLDSPASIDNLLRTYTPENKGITNLFCLRSVRSIRRTCSLSRQNIRG